MHTFRDSLLRRGHGHMVVGYSTIQERCPYTERVLGLGLWGITPLSTIF
jgi:hypothetical protein